MSVSESVDNRPTFHSERHVRYWLRCLKTVLPTEYTSNDSNRMTLGFFILAAFDLLDILHTKTTAAERQSCVDWIYHCQHPKGGFRGFPGTDFGGLRTADNAHWDPASLPGTYFALLTLAVLGDDLRRMHKRKCLAWMRRLQREDGSFGEMLGLHGKIEGNRDTRFCYFAASVRWMLGCGKRKSRTSTASDIDVGALVQYINACEVCKTMNDSTLLSTQFLIFARPSTMDTRRLLIEKHTVRPKSLPLLIATRSHRSCRGSGLLRHRYPRDA